MGTIWGAIYPHLQSLLQKLAASLLLIACITGIAVELIPIFIIKLSVFGGLKAVRLDILFMNIAMSVGSYLAAASVMLTILPLRWRLLRGIGLAWLGAGLAGIWQAYRNSPYDSVAEWVYFEGIIASVCVCFCLYLGVALDRFERWYAGETQLLRISSNDSHDLF